MSDETFIPSSDRPVSINLDSPLSELRVRDLAVLLERLGRPQKIHPKFEGHSPLKEFFDKPFPEVLAPLDPNPHHAGVPTPIDDLLATVLRKLDAIEARLGDTTSG